MLSSRLIHLYRDLCLSLCKNMYKGDIVGIKHRTIIAEGSITVWLFSGLTGLDPTKQENMLFLVRINVAESCPVKLVTVLCIRSQVCAYIHLLIDHYCWRIFWLTNEFHVHDGCSST